MENSPKKLTAQSDLVIPLSSGSVFDQLDFHNSNNAILTTHLCFCFVSPFPDQRRTDQAWAATRLHDTDDQIRTEVTIFIILYLHLHKSRSICQPCMSAILCSQIMNDLHLR